MAFCEACWFALILAGKVINIANARPKTTVISAVLAFLRAMFLVALVKIPMSCRPLTYLIRCEYELLMPTR